MRNYMPKLAPIILKVYAKQTYSHLVRSDYEEEGIAPSIPNPLTFFRWSTWRWRSRWYRVRFVRCSECFGCWNRKRSAISPSLFAEFQLTRLPFWRNVGHSSKPWLRMGKSKHRKMNCIVRRPYLRFSSVSCQLIVDWCNFFNCWGART